MLPCSKFDFQFREQIQIEQTPNRKIETNEIMKQTKTSKTEKSTENEKQATKTK
jgi:hypothetical protein